MFEHRPPVYPVRREAVLGAAMKQLMEGDWARLEGCPETEADLAAFHGPDFKGNPAQVWFISSGTASLEAIMLGHGIGPGDEVITVPYTWGATVSAVLAIGAIPVFADVDPVTGLINPAAIAPLVGPKTKAILAVHFFGQACDERQLRQIADDHDTLLLIDGSQAHGVRLHGERVGHWAHAAAFSCMGMKLLAGTEGGYALFRDSSAAEVAYLYGKHPRGLPTEQAERLQNEGLLDTLQLGWRACSVGGALVKAALPHLDDENGARRANAAVLRRELASCKAITMPGEIEGAEGAYHLLSLLYHEEHGVARGDFLANLEARKVDHFIYIPTPIHRMRRMKLVDENGPPVLWRESLRAAGHDMDKISCPGAEQRSAISFEMGFNWTEPNEAAMVDLAANLMAASEG